MRLARRADELGFRRIWYAEHHGLRARAADFPPAVVIAHMAAMTSRIRLGSGGVLAPNHAPLDIAEQFGALSALHPGRIDMGIGRGPGTYDQEAARAMRRGAPAATDEEYRADVAAVLGFAAEREEVPEPWMLSSSSAGSTLAAELGMPLAFAYHLRPENAVEAVERYREAFTPSAWCEAPRVLVCVQVVCACTDAVAESLVRPYEVMKAGAARGVPDQPLPSPQAAAAHLFTQEEQDVVQALRAHTVQGGPETVVRRLTETADRLGADELSLFMPVYDADDRIRSLELTAEAWR